MPRIVLFGATGYTGALTAHSLVRRGAQPLLAARSEQKLAELTDELGVELPTAVADVSDPASIAALLQPGDVLISTVGPFVRWGQAAAQAAIDSGAHYIDSTGEGAFIREVFTEFGPKAKQAGIAMLTAMGYDYAPGHLAGALAVQRGGADVTGLRIGYFNAGAAFAVSGGTAASSSDAMFYPAHAYVDAQVVTEPTASRIHDFGEVEPGVPARAFTVGTSEPYSLPRLFPQLRDIDAMLGWNDPDKVQGQVAKLAPLLADPQTREDLMAKNRERLTGSTGGPDAAARAQTSVIFAEGRNAAGDTLASVRLDGANGYDFTADFMAVTAERLLAGEVSATGAIGPLEAFDLETLTALTAEAGIAEQS